ncbi:MAG: adenine phosphoribosyltransferase [candidate division Zixibacteria bacterium SM23_73_2]|nr:MAG: adenine phosphoribosyltransferase [candidate division Zixibacteria bacterium SM23_73_2]
MQKNLKKLIRDVPDYPKKGVVFKDITTLLKDGNAFREVVDILCDSCKGKKIDLVAAIESRGFILGGALADRLGMGIIPVRKRGKLPSDTIVEKYDLEYGTDSLEMHTDAVFKGQRVLIVDDLLATGGTLEATAKLVEKLEGIVVGISVMIELSYLKGRDKISKYDFFSIIQYEKEYD